MGSILEASRGCICLDFWTFVACICCKAECSGTSFASRLFDFIGLLIGVLILLRGGPRSVGVCDAALEGGWKHVLPVIALFGLTGSTGTGAWDTGPPSWWGATMWLFSPKEGCPERAAAGWNVLVSGEFSRKELCYLLRFCVDEEALTGNVSLAWIATGNRVILTLMGSSTMPICTSRVSSGLLAPCLFVYWSYAAELRMHCSSRSLRIASWSGASERICRLTLGDTSENGELKHLGCRFLADPVGSLVRCESVYPSRELLEVRCASGNGAFIRLFLMIHVSKIALGIWGRRVLLYLFDAIKGVLRPDLFRTAGCSTW